MPPKRKKEKDIIDEDVYGILPAKKAKVPSIVDNLLQVAKKDKCVNMPTFQSALFENQIQQADLLFLPNDNNYRYALVVVDNYSKMCDAEPIKTKTNDAVLAAFKTIYKRKILTLPTRKIEVDAGTEFKGSVSKYFRDNNVTVRVANTGRHRQQALVERKNQAIGKAIFKRQTHQEVLTGEVSTDWIKDLPTIVKLLNVRAARNLKKQLRKKKKTKISTDPRCSGDACNLIPIDTKVRVALEYPINPATGERIHGKFRSTDIRFNPAVRVVKDILLTPNQPPMYLLDGNVGRDKIEPVAYTKAQLQIIPSNEKAPNYKAIRGKPKQWVAEKIVGKKKINNKILYKVHWYGFEEKDDTWEPASKLKQEIPDLIKTYESGIKK